MKLRILKPVARVGTIATVLCVCSATSWATLKVTFDNIIVTPGTPTATSFVRISSDQTPLEQFNAANINVQVEPFLARELRLDSYTPTPPGSVWDGAPIFSFASPALDGVIMATKTSTLISNGTNVAADGDILFSVDFNTSAGLLGDKFTVNLDNLAGINPSSIGDAQGNTLFAGAGVIFLPGTITIVREPSELDFNNDTNIDVEDVDTLVREIVAGPPFNPVFDLSGEGTVDDKDLAQWLTDAAPHNGFSEAYLLGDSNLDGQVNTVDLNNLALNWRQDVALWSAGDFTADGIVNSIDLNELAINWRQSISVAAATNASVPEPSALLLTVVALALVWRRSTCGYR